MVKTGKDSSKAGQLICQVVIVALFGDEFGGDESDVHQICSGPLTPHQTVC
jgi:hypothetical protein